MVAAALMAALPATQAQERLERSEALKYAFMVSADLDQLLGTPITTDPDVKRPLVLRDGEYGCMLLPEAKLRVQSIERLSNDRTLPVGQLWLRKLAPLDEDRVVSESRLRMVEVSGTEGNATVPCCALGLRKTSSGGYELLVFGKDKEPVLRAPVKTLSETAKPGVDLTAERQNDGGLLTLTVLGKYQASFKVTDPEKY